MAPLQLGWKERRNRELALMKDLAATHKTITESDQSIRTLTAKHNTFLKELGLPLLPTNDSPQ